MRRKFLCLFLCLTLLFSLMPMSVSAASEPYIIVDGYRYENVNSDLSGNGWYWNAASKALVLDNYSGGSILTNVDMRITALTGTTNTIYSASSYHTCIKSEGTLGITANGNITLVDINKGDKVIGISAKVLNLYVGQKGTLTCDNYVNTLLYAEDKSDINCYGSIISYGRLLIAGNDTTIAVNGASSSIKALNRKNVSTAVAIDGNCDISGEGKIVIGTDENAYDHVWDAEGDLTIRGDVSFSAYSLYGCIMVRDFLAKDNVSLCLEGKNSAIGGRNVTFMDNVYLKINNRYGLSASNTIIFENSTIDARVEERFSQSGGNTYYRPTGNSKIISGGDIFFIDHTSIYAEGKGTDYLEAKTHVFFASYGSTVWNRDGEATLISEGLPMYGLSDLTGNGTLTLKSTQNDGMVVNQKYYDRGCQIEYNGTINIESYGYGIRCYSNREFVIKGDNTININSHLQGIANVGPLTIDGTGNINIHADCDIPAIESRESSVTINRDGDINLIACESHIIVGYEDVIIGGDGLLKAAATGTVLHSDTGDIYIRDNRTLDIRGSVGAISFGDSDKAMYLEGTGSPLIITDFRNNTVLNSDRKIVDNTGKYYVLEGSLTSGRIVYSNEEIPDPTPEVTPSVTPEVTPVVTPETTPAVTPTVTSTPSVTPTPVATPEVTTTPSVTTTPVVTPSTTTTPVATPEITPKPTEEVVPNNPSTMVEGEYTEADIPVVNPIVEEAELDVGDFVQRCYKVALEREAEEEGYKYWCDSLNNGQACGAQVGFGFIFSQEYMNKEKSNEDFVNDLYAMFFGREADSEGYAYWLSALENGDSREKVFAGFANSQEFYDLCKKYAVVSGWYAVGIDNGSQGGVNCFVARLYKICFKRLPDLGGQAYWVSQLIDGSLDGTTAASGFVFSAEFTNLELTDEEFVAYMYAAFFARKADVQGFNYWMTEIRNGMSRNDVFSGFTGSAEFINLCDSYGIIA